MNDPKHIIFQKVLQNALVCGGLRILLLINLNPFVNQWKLKDKQEYQIFKIYGQLLKNVFHNNNSTAKSGSHCTHTSKLGPTDLQNSLPIVFLYTKLPKVLQTVTA